MQVRVEYKDTPPQVFISEPSAMHQVGNLLGESHSPKERDLEEQHQSRQQ